MGVEAGWAARQKEGVVEGVIKLQTADTSGEAAGTPPGGVQGADPINQCESQPTQTFLRSLRADLKSWPERARLSLTPQSGDARFCTFVRAKCLINSVAPFSALSSPTRAESEARLQLCVYSAEMRWDCRMCVSPSRLKSLLPQWGWCAPGLPPPLHPCLSPTTLPGIVLHYVGPVLLFLHHFYQWYTFTQEDGFTEKLFRLIVK